MAASVMLPAGVPAAKPPAVGGVTDFSSDVGRKKFGFSHEELDDSTAYYEGQFKLYQRCGEGTLHSLETGAKYVGQFMADVFHGSGRQVWPDGSKYNGQWHYGQKHGKGEYISEDGLLYTGQWEEGRRHGQGVQEYANQDRYEGWWFHGLCSGLGSYQFADGSRYEGTWANGRYDGSGVLYGADGSREHMEYSAGLLMKREVMTPGSAPTKASRRDLITIKNGKVLQSQSREEMQRAAQLPRAETSRYLIARETAGMDLSAPSLVAQAREKMSSLPPIGR
eukprot:TRINITY_DN23790_c0_g2_i1.p1 TRINITY_DN23790_c0_g2~~TRINITY_DN23790_c0_g2_i1.p1  ORF type:complete len:280 (+),score=37.65 TRINITY_DN23790_c0_g2_i1:137-976(+)